MKRGLVFCLFIGILFFSSPAKAADWRFPVGLTYVSGFGDVVDIYEDNLVAEGYRVYDTGNIPVGLSFQPYVQFDSGLGVGVGIGPISAIIGDASFVDFPLGLDVRYAFVPSANVSPYARAGVRYHFASGDYVKGSTPGFLGGIGVEFARKKPVGFGFEISYDSAEIEIERVRTNSTENIRPYGLTVSIFAVF